MRSLAEWFDDYGVCHQHPVNRRIHQFCVPAIQFSLLGLLWLVPLPLPGLNPVANLAVLLVLLVMPFYLLLSWRIAIGMLFVSLCMLFIIFYADMSGVLLEISLVIFVLAWLGQFWGHHIEGRKPSFFDDLRFLLIGPLWVLSHLYDALGITNGKPD